MSDPSQIAADLAYARRLQMELWAAEDAAEDAAAAPLPPFRRDNNNNYHTSSRRRLSAPLTPAASYYPAPVLPLTPDAPPPPPPPPLAASLPAGGAGPDALQSSSQEESAAAQRADARERRRRAERRYDTRHAHTTRTPDHVADGDAVPTAHGHGYPTTAATATATATTTTTTTSTTTTMRNGDEGQRRRVRAPGRYRSHQQQWHGPSVGGGNRLLRTPHAATATAPPAPAAPQYIGHQYHPPSSLPHAQPNRQPYYPHPDDDAAPGTEHGAYHPGMYHDRGRHAPSPITYHAYDPYYESESLFGQHYGNGSDGRRRRRGASGTPGGAAPGQPDSGEGLAREANGNSPFGFFFGHHHHPTDIPANRPNANRGDDPSFLGGIFVREQSFFTPALGSGGAFHITTTGGGSGHVGFGVREFHVTDSGNTFRSTGPARAGTPDVAANGPQAPLANPDFMSVFDSVFANLFGAMNPHMDDDMAHRHAEHAVPGLQPFFAQAFANMGLMGTFFNDEDRSYEEWQQLVDRMGNASRGATEEEISRLPTESFSQPKKSARVDASASSSSSTTTSPSRPDEEPEKCPICLGEYEDGDEIKRLPCMHKFCNPCISRWLQTSKECPCCKASIRDTSGAHASC